MGHFDEAAWKRLVRDTISREDILAALERPERNPSVKLERHASPEQLRILFSWTGCPLWHLQAFSLRLGIGEGEASRAHTAQEVSQLVGHSAPYITDICGRNGVPLILGGTFHLLERAPEGTGFNPFLEIGIPTRFWRPLAWGDRQQKGVFTLRGLCELKADDIRGLRSIGPKGLESIVEALNAKGLSLRPVE